MKKYLTNVFVASMMIGATVCVSSCDNKPGKAAATPETKAANNEKSDKAETGKLAYVCIDSILNNYEFCKEHSKVLEKRMTNIQATLASKGKALENAAMNFQKRIQSGEIKSEEEARKVQASLQKQQADLESLQAKYSEQFEKERQKYNDEMKDSIESFLSDYNKDGKYSMIISKVGDNLLYADKKLDITDDVLNGLNKRYKSSTSKKSDKK